MKLSLLYIYIHNVFQKRKFFIYCSSQHSSLVKVFIYKTSVDIKLNVDENKELNLSLNKLEMLESTTFIWYNLDEKWSWMSISKYPDNMKKYRVKTVKKKVIMIKVFNKMYSPESLYFQLLFFIIHGWTKASSTVNLNLGSEHINLETKCLASSLMWPQKFSWNLYFPRTIWRSNFVSDLSSEPLKKGGYPHNMM